MERRLRLVLKLVMFDGGTLIEDHLGDGIGEVHIPEDSRIAFDDGGATSGAGEDDRPGMRRQSRSVGVRQVEEVDRLVQNGMSAGSQRMLHPQPARRSAP